MEEKYYIHSKLNDYLNYKNDNKKSEYVDIVKLVNVEMHIDWLDNMKDTDISKNELMLVNRIYGLSEEFVPEDLVEVPSKYAYSGKKLSQSVLDEVIKLIDDGKNQGYTFVISDGYRSYKEQKDIYDSYADYYGMSETDTFVARPGHSEYQTGMSFDLKPYNKVIDDVSNNEEYLWLRENAYKYGFIFRFEKEDEHLTGFSENNWRLRYVGKEAAGVIKNEDLCFEEYYAFYVGE
jgi:D-alanyl-D-alanine carboxypeptidase